LPFAPFLFVFNLAVDYRFGHALAMKLLLFVLLILPGVLFAQGGLPNQPYIYVEGKAEIEKPADMVTLRFEVVARAPNEQKANAEVQAKANKVFELTKERKISNEDVIAESLRSEPQFENEENYQRRGKLIGYVVMRPFEVKVRDVASFPKLADELVAIGGVDFSVIEGGLQKEREMQEELWTKAITNAREQAEKTLNPVGMKVDSVFAISPVPVPEISSRMFPKDRAGGAGAERVIVTGSNIPTAEGAKPSQYHLAPVTVTQIVHIIYLTSPAK
jgi:uncharacterized protein YggE